jgi:hypothetical protein
MKYQTSEKPLSNHWIDGWNTGRFNTKHAQTDSRKNTSEWQNGYLIGSQERESVSSANALLKGLRRLSII